MGTKSKENWGLSERGNKLANTPARVDFELFWRRWRICIAQKIIQTVLFRLILPKIQ